MKKNEAWATFSFTESMAPLEGWKTDGAIFSTYSTDLVVIVTLLLTLSGCDLSHRRTGSRVELINAIEALRGRVRVLSQAGRITIPQGSLSILKLLDQFVLPVEINENVGSWHPKAALVRYHNSEKPTDHQWRVWLGSRNLTRAFNWEAGLLLVSRTDGGGQHIEGLPAVAETLARRAKLLQFPLKDIAAEFGKLTWDCPKGCDVRRVTLLGPGLTKGFPTPPSNTQRVLLVSPFLDAATIRAAGRWGGAKTRRAIVSTELAFQRLLQEDSSVFERYDDLRLQPLPDLPGECADSMEDPASLVVQTAEAEELPPAGLHAKLFYAATNHRRQLWIGSANATERAWSGRNYEIMAEISLDSAPADAMEVFLATCERFDPTSTTLTADDNQEVLEKARKALSTGWLSSQRIVENDLDVIANSPPSIPDSRIRLEIAVMGGAWTEWPHHVDRLRLQGVHPWQRSNLLQVRVSRAEYMCAWVQMVPCEPPPDEKRDQGLIAEYLDARTFLVWLRSLLAHERVRADGGDWDGDPRSPNPHLPRRQYSTMSGDLPTLEEILRSWARDSSAFAAADEKVRIYLADLKQRATERGAMVDAELLENFLHFWNGLASELR